MNKFTQGSNRNQQAPLRFQKKSINVQRQSKKNWINKLQPNPKGIIRLPQKSQQDAKINQLSSTRSHVDEWATFV